MLQMDVFTVHLMGLQQWLLSRFRMEKNHRVLTQDSEPLLCTLTKPPLITQHKIACFRLRPMFFSRRCMSRYHGIPNPSLSIKGQVPLFLSTHDLVSSTRLHCTSLLMAPRVTTYVKETRDLDPGFNSTIQNSISPREEVFVARREMV